MAILNELDLAGLLVSNAYWRIGALEWNTNQPNLVRLRIDGYASQEAYQDGSSALRSVEKELILDPEKPDTVAILFAQVRSVCYREIKGMVGFEDAIDA